MSSLKGDSMMRNARRNTRQLALLLLGCCWSLLLQANQPVPVVKQLLPDAHLVGAGRLRWFGFSVYDAELWRARGQGTVDPRTDAYALRLVYLRDIDAEDLVETSLEEMDKQGASAEELARWEPKLKQLFPAIKAGDELTAWHTPGRVELFDRSRRLGFVEDERFSALFLGIWLGDKTREPVLRDRLLGRRR